MQLSFFLAKFDKQPILSMLYSVDRTVKDYPYLFKLRLKPRASLVAAPKN